MKTQILRKQLVEAMKDSKLTQTQLAQKTGVTQWAISRFLSGNNISAEYALLLQDFILNSSNKLSA